MARKRNAPHGKKSKVEEQKPDVFDRLNKFFDSKLTVVFWLSMAVALIISLLMFDTKVSIGGDDSEYIIGAKKFLEGTQFPTWHGSFYPIFLSFFTLIFGINVVAFKVISIPLMLGHHFFMFKTFKSRVPSFVLFILLLVLALNAHILYFSSSTYSESMFFFLQGLALYIFFKLDDKLNEGATLSESWKKWLGFGGVMFLLFLSRNIGLGLIIAAVLYFLLNKKWMASLYTVASFLVFQLPFILYKKLVWGIIGSGAEGQFRTMFYKHFYDRSQGTEDFMGFLVRIWDNSMLYLSKHLYILLGFKPLGSTDTNAFLVIFTYLLFFVALYLIFKNKKQFFFVGIYLSVMIGATFVSQQKHWDQYRLILIYVPLIVLMISMGFYQLTKLKYLKFLQIFLAVFLLVVPLLMLKQSVDQIKTNMPNLSKNMEGNTLYGFTPDWINYIEMCRYAAKTVPADAGIACRKPNIASIYANGRDFDGFYRVPSQNADSLLLKFENRNIKYVVLGSLRINPKMKTDRIINTMQNYLAIIQQKYPHIFRQLHTIGSDEPAYLIEILWENRSVVNTPKGSTQ
ncbi:MAG: hypothetical protein K9H64_20995 [Bacteroidales bacterium]|nr:hypothetical protein [Bacteroidales bacterium]MCF8458503.1 hypothetical protein [Bacteroidales bacterium]